MEKFDKRLTTEIAEKVQEVLRSHYGDDTLEFAIQGGKFGSDKLNLNLVVRMKDSTGKVVVSDSKHTIADNAVKAAGVEFTGHILGSKWSIKDEVYVVMDYITKRPKYPILLKRADGTLSKCTAKFFKSGVQLVKPTCTEFDIWCRVDPESDAVKESDVEICDRVWDWIDATYDADKVQELNDYIDGLFELHKVEKYTSFIYCELDGGIDRAIKYAKDAYNKELSSRTKKSRRA